MSVNPVDFNQINQYVRPNSIQIVSSITSSIDIPADDTVISDVTRYYSTSGGLRQGRDYTNKFAFSNGLNFWVEGNYKLSLQKGDKIQVSFEDNGNIARVSTIRGNTYFFRKFSLVGYSYYE